MSNRTLVELNHDYCPNDARWNWWVQKIQTYLHTGDPAYLPDGVTFKHMRHHSEPCPLDELARLARENEELKARISKAVEIVHQSDIHCDTEAWLCGTLEPYEEKPL